MIPYSQDAMQLLMDGAVALTEAECSGICVDEIYLHDAMRRTKKQIKLLEQELEDTEVMRTWRKTFGLATKLGSGKQLAIVLHDKMGFPVLKKTAKEGRATDEEALEMIEDPFVDGYLEIKKLTKGSGTYLKSLLRESVDGKVHCNFNLHIAKSYRSSLDDPALHQIPIRDPQISKLVRSAIVPRPGRRLIEVDFASAEVRVSGAYCKDPRLIEYIHDPTKDMHRDMAMECYKLPLIEITKAIRNSAKSGFVFAEFYGNWYLDCAKGLWKMSRDLKTASGVPIREHLLQQGIKGLGNQNPKAILPGTLEAHIQKVEEAFWGERFKVYAKWKKDYYEAYRRKGWFKTLTGFICQGYMERNKVVNYPIQGSSFHCLLWCLLAIMKEMKRRGMKSLIILQIHDSILFDAVPEEVDDLIALSFRIIKDELSKHWPWLAPVGMDAECEGAGIDEPWAMKKKIKVV